MYWEGPLMTSDFRVGGSKMTPKKIALYKVESVGHGRYLGRKSSDVINGRSHINYAREILRPIYLITLERSQ